MRYLHVYQTDSGEWAGILLEDRVRIAGCKNPSEVLYAAFEHVNDAEIEVLPPGNCREICTGDELLACLREKPLQRLIQSIGYAQPYNVVEYNGIFDSDMSGDEVVVAVIPKSSDADALRAETEKQYSDNADWRALPLVMGLYDGTYCLPEYLEAWIRANPDCPAPYGAHLKMIS